MQWKILGREKFVNCGGVRTRRQFMIMRILQMLLGTASIWTSSARAIVKVLRTVVVDMDWCCTRGWRVHGRNCAVRAAFVYQSPWLPSISVTKPSIVLLSNRPSIYLAIFTNFLSISHQQRPIFCHRTFVRLSFTLRRTIPRLSV
jgi:hypothetical protein